MAVCLQSLDALVEELLREQPNEKRVKAYMSKLGLTYSTDSTARMEAVLEILRTRQKKRGPTQRSRKIHERSV